MTEFGIIERLCDIIGTLNDNGSSNIKIKKASCEIAELIKDVLQNTYCQSITDCCEIDKILTTSGRK